ncbi:MAG: deoxyribodipyrimidine photo-lyase [Actinomycetota bacterium]
MSIALVWFRRDLRLDDHPALEAARRDHDEVACLYVLEPRLRAAAGRRRRDQHAAFLTGLDAALREQGARLLVVEGDPSSVVPRLVDELDAAAVHVNADTTPHAVRRDAAVAAALGVPLVEHWGTLVHPPGTVLTGKGTLSQVFTPFYRRWAATERAAPPGPGSGRLVAPDVAGAVAVPRPDAEPALAGGTDAVAARVEAFAGRVGTYEDQRDLLAVDGTSGLSVDLRFGTVSPTSLADRFDPLPGGEPFVRQLAWRDWYAHLLAERPHLPDAALKPAYDGIAWRDDDQGFAAWCEARTGYPIVDAAMRQLLETGLMHNRARMIVGSFLVKDLLIDWRRGERFFRRLLLDGDVASNAGNWQWVAGTGADAAPYFRIFNPISQSRKFDPTGAYLRRWLPELAELDDGAIHWPLDAGPLELQAAGVTLGETYPEPIVDHGAARDRCLAAYQAAVKR